MNLRNLLTAIQVIIILILVIIIVILVGYNSFKFPQLQNPETLNIFLTFALVIFGSIEAVSTIFKFIIERNRKRTVDLRNELEKLYGPVQSILNNVVYAEIGKAVLTQNEKKMLDEIFSREPHILDSQEEWKLNFHIHKEREIDAHFIDKFIEEYENERGREGIEKQFSFVYSMLKNIPQNVETVAILSPYEKKMIDNKFLTYPYMVDKELYNYWNTKIRTLRPTIERILGHILALQENLKNPRNDSEEIGVYLIPKVFVLEFFKEYENKVYAYKKL